MECLSKENRSNGFGEKWSRFCGEQTKTVSRSRVSLCLSVSFSLSLGLIALFLLGPEDPPFRGCSENAPTGSTVPARVSHPVGRALILCMLYVLEHVNG